MDKRSYTEVPPPPPYFGPGNDNISAHPPTQHTHVIQTVVNRQIGPHPMSLNCTTCGATIITRVDVVPSTKTHLLAALICMFGGLCCFCIPYCMDSCQNINHYCPNCNTFIGTYSS